MSSSKRQLSEQIIKRVLKYLKKRPPQHCPFMEDVVDVGFCTMSDHSDCESQTFQKGCWELLIDQALGEIPVKAYVSKED